MNQGEVSYEMAYTYDEQGIMSRVTYGAPGEGDKQFSEYLSIGAVPLGSQYYHGNLFIPDDLETLAL